VFTLNNYTTEEEKEIREWETKYKVVGKEKGKSGTQHLQGYIELEKSLRLGTLKKRFPRMHVEKRRGTAKQAAEYCKKEGNFWEEGEISNQGKRSDLEEVADMVKEKKTSGEIADAYPSAFIRYHKGIERMASVLAKDRKEKPFVTWYWGSTGVGKTSTAYNAHESVYIKDGTQWWDGYSQQEAIIIDDFDGKWPYKDLLRLLDRYPYQGQYKGGYTKINSPFIYITCTKPPEALWRGEEIEQIKRRLDMISCLGTKKSEDMEISDF